MESDMKNKISAVLMIMMLIAVPQASAEDFNQSAKKAGDIALAGVGTLIAVPVAAAGLAVVLPVMLLAAMSGGMDY